MSQENLNLEYTKLKQDIIKKTEIEKDNNLLSFILVKILTVLE